MRELKRLIEEYESLAENAPSIVSDYFSKTRNDVNSFSEQLVQHVNKCSEDLKLKINEYEQECYKNVARLKVSTLADIKSELDQLEKRSAQGSDLIEEAEKESNKLVQSIKSNLKKLDEEILCADQNVVHVRCYFAECFH